MLIRPANEDELNMLVDIWLRSVRATHDFLTAADIQEFLPLVRQGLPTLELWVLCAADDRLIGFMGLSDNKLEALFLAPDLLRRGGGRLLVRHAQGLKGELTVDVNEPNPAAFRFYEACGFEAYGRSELDSTGRPFPLIHMRLGNSEAQQKTAAI